VNAAVVGSEVPLFGMVESVAGGRRHREDSPETPFGVLEVPPLQLDHADPIEAVGRSGGLLGRKLQ